MCEHHPEHDDECGYTEGATGIPCSHEHTDDCYTEVIECVHEHDEDCYPQESVLDDEATPSNAEAVNVSSVQAMIDVLPDAEEIGKDNAEDVEAQLEAIDEAKAVLSSGKLDELDFTRYMEAAAALEQLLYGVGIPSNAIMLASYDGPAIQLGTGGISGPTENTATKGEYYAPGSYIYFGVNSGNNSTPIKWRVLDADNANDGTTSGMFLLSEYLLASRVKFNNSDSGSGYYNYQGSAAQSWCSSFATNAGNFSTTEQGAMLGVAKNDSSENLYSRQ